MRIRTALAAALVGLALVFLSAGPAAAHTGKLKLVVAGDGADGVTVQASYADGHRPDLPVSLVLTATGPDDRKVGPVELQPSTEGQGFYITGPLLSPGRWTVTVTAPASIGGTGTARVEARAAEPVPPPPTARARADARDVTEIRAAGRTGESTWWLPVGVGVLALLVVAGALTAFVGRRRRP
ncbi:hypothetical protein [Micromonospora cathayae]|uniref:CopC domain-containing protein n=1 Tax=Micromonospora cathayae TaxID=3028804 RepID=A0ABY7ZQM2_9ACTN|nr:hypothetical protein [Micromonospora sp. HUAS 3]WDZ85326.1 hypothetical protein PVK37_02355 [Micromonospora sp. HUAS 3]